jgi:hypothetical protein
MTRLAAAALIIVVVLAGCALISPQLDVAVENNSDQEAVLEIVDGITGTVPPPATISRAAVPAQQTTTVSMTRAAEWSLLVNGAAVYDSLHAPDAAQSLSLGVEIAPDGSVNVLTP